MTSASKGERPVPTAKRRVFVGVPLSRDLQKHVEEVQGLLEPVPGMRLLSPEQFHVTLAFIGYAEEEVVERARRVVAGVSGSLGGSATLGGFLAFPSARRARVVTLEIADDAGIFGRLFEEVMTGLETEAVTEREKRPFRPHLTVARLKKPGPVQLRTDVEPAEFAVESVCLFESRLRRTGAEYTVLERRTLGAE
ncbi:MAG: hypothetical protein Kow00129_14690 [Thermoleophilia bacterium]